MPILSGMPTASYADDTKFKPVTTFPASYAPDHTFMFDVTKDYLGADFAFDTFEGLFPLLLTDIVDENFLICRYERLFLRQGSKPYYCVPWMAVPCTKNASGKCLLSQHNFVLRVHRQITPGFLVLANRTRKVQLRPSAGIQASWRSKKNASSQKDIREIADVAAFKGEDIDLTVADGVYSDAGEYIEIMDLTDNKIVGKLRIIFLEKLTVESFPIKIEEVGNQFRFSRLTANDVPASLESLGSASGFAHGKITDDSNLYGFNKIGLTVSFDSTGITIGGVGGAPVALAGVPNGFAEIPKTNIATLEQYGTLCGKFLGQIGYLQSASNEYTKFARVFVFVTPFQIYTPKASTTTGVSISTDDEQAQIADTRPKYATHPITTWPPNASLFESWKGALPLQGDWQVNGKVKQTYSFKTLIHEVSHALFSGHTFPAEKKDMSQQVISTHAEVCRAHKWLRLYLLNDLSKNIYSSFDNDKVCIEDFTTGQIVGGRSETLFDTIISKGMDLAIESFIDEKIFSTGTRPSIWAGIDTTRLIFAEVEFWIALNDIVKFTQSTITGNLMDYISSGLRFTKGPTALASDAYFKQAVYGFNRFQWELVRKSSRRLKQTGQIF